MKPRFVFNTGQRNGVFALALVILVLLGVIYWLKHQPSDNPKTPQEIQEEEMMQEFVDSIKKLKSKPKSYKTYPFNPNFITDYKGYKLGMSPKEIDRLHQFRKQDKWVNSKADFQQVTKVSDSLLAEISPYFKFPDWVTAKRKGEGTKHEIYPFNPNFITASKGDKLGMSPKEINRLHQFRKQDKWVNSKADFQGVTKVSDSLLNKISPYFKFPDWVIAKRKRQAQEGRNRSEELPYAQKTDLNDAGMEDLQEVSGIGEVLARRIIRYRSKLGGFVDDVQLKDVYGLSYKTRENLLVQFTVKSNTDVKKLDINTATTAELTDIVYFDYELARKIVNYRITHEGITTFEELAKIEEFPAGRIQRIKLYLKIELSEN